IVNHSPASSTPPDVIAPLVLNLEKEPRVRLDLPAAVSFTPRTETPIPGCGVHAQHRLDHFASQLKAIARHTTHDAQRCTQLRAAITLRRSSAATQCSAPPVQGSIIVAHTCRRPRSG